MWLSTVRLPLFRHAVLGTGALLLLTTGSARGACPEIIRDFDNDHYLGCCDLNGTPVAQGQPCVDEQNPCKVGTCGTAGGDCVPISGPSGNRSGGALCRSLVDPCQQGDCSNGNCTGPFDLTTECTADGNQCTDDCRPNDATTTNLFDVTCGPFVVQGLSCSIANGTASCSRGICDAGAVCQDIPTEAAVPCDLNLNQCQQAVCTRLDPNNKPICEKVPKDIGLSCESAPKADQPAYCDPNAPDYNPVNNAFCTSDCKSKTCKDNGSCSFNYKPFQGWACENDAEVCTKGVCNNSGNCGSTQTLPNQRPCTTDGNVCSWDICLGGACSHTQDDPNVPDGAACTSTNSCAEAAQCQGAACVVTDCHEGDVFCQGCAGTPCNGGAPSTGCGCPQ